MNRLIDCSLLMKIKDISRVLEIDLVLLIGIILLAKEGFGRIAISRSISVKERKVRKVIENLFKDKDKNYIDVLHSFNAFNARELNVGWLRCVPVLYTGFELKILHIVKSNIIALRDYIVINSRDPRKLEVIGVLQGKEIDLPGVPRELLEPYNDLIKVVQAGENGIIVCWNNYNKHMDNAILLASIVNLCSSI